MQKYAKHVGLKRDFRLVVRGAARNMIKILNGSGKLLENLFYFPEHLMLYFLPSVFIFIQIYIMLLPIFPFSYIDIKTE